MSLGVLSGPTNSAIKVAKTPRPSDARLLPTEHDELMPRHEQFDVLGELAAPAPDKQPQHSREGEIGEGGEEHPPMLPRAHHRQRRDREPRF
jgi:hypothetical protein